MKKKLNEGNINFTTVDKIEKQIRYTRPSVFPCFNHFQIESPLAPKVTASKNVTVQISIAVGDKAFFFFVIDD